MSTSLSHSVSVEYGGQTSPINPVMFVAIGTKPGCLVLNLFHFRAATVQFPISRYGWFSSDILTWETPEDCFNMSPKLPVVVDCVCFCVQHEEQTALVVVASA